MHPHQAHIVLCGQFDTTVMLGDDLAVSEPLPSPSWSHSGSPGAPGRSTMATGTAANTRRCQMTTDDRKLDKHGILVLAQEAESTASLLLTASIWSA